MMDEYVLLLRFLVISIHLNIKNTANTIITLLVFGGLYNVTANKTLEAIKEENNPYQVVLVGPSATAVSQSPAVV